MHFFTWNICQSLLEFYSTYNFNTLKIKFNIWQCWDCPTMIKILPTHRWVNLGSLFLTLKRLKSQRLYKGPRQSPLPQLTATRSTGNISVRTESQPQQHTWTSEFFVLFPLRNHCCYIIMVSDINKSELHVYFVSQSSTPYRIFAIGKYICPFRGISAF